MAAAAFQGSESEPETEAPTSNMAAAALPKSMDDPSRKDMKRFLPLASGPCLSRLTCGTPVALSHWNHLVPESKALEKMYANIAAETELCPNKVKQVLRTFKEHGEKHLLAHGQLNLADMADFKIFMKPATLGKQHIS